METMEQNKEAILGIGQLSVKEPMYGIIDIGSNTMRLSCYKIVGKELSYVFHKKSMAGLASYINQDGDLTEKGIEKAVKILNDFHKISDSIGLEQVYVIATASLRNVSNTLDIIKMIKDRTSYEVEVLTGEEEAMFDFVGATFFTKAAEGLITDIGGGSTELVFYSGETVSKAVSIPIGSLKLYTEKVKKFFPKKNEVDEIRKCVKEELKKLQIKRQEKVIVGVGGTNRAVCKLYNDTYDLPSNNRIMECSKISDMFLQISENKDLGRKQILQIIPERIHTILPGMIVLEEIINCYNCEQVEISPWGVREGYLLVKL